MELEQEFIEILVLLLYYTECELFFMCYVDEFCFIMFCVNCIFQVDDSKFGNLAHQAVDFILGILLFSLIEELFLLFFIF